MRIMLLTQIVPYPPDAGPRIKTLNVLKYLGQFHEVHLVSFVRRPEEVAHARFLEPFCASITTVPLQRSMFRDAGYLAKSVVSGRPFLVERDDSIAMRQAIGRLLSGSQFDAVHADQLSMAQFAVDLPVPLRVLDEHNAVWTIVRRSAAHEARGPRRLAAEMEWRKLKAYEGGVCKRFDLVTVVSSHDYLDLAEAAGAIFPAKIIPICVDCHDELFVPRTADSRHLISVATMFYPPNVDAVHWFSKMVFPIVRGDSAGVEFRIVGSKPPETIVELAKPGSGIVVTGYVPELAPLLRESAVMVVPLRSGSGMRVKILEAFARGIPVVSTSIGVEGIDARHGEHLLVADTPEEFASAVTSLLRDPNLGQRLSRNGRQLVETQFDWRTALRPLDAIYPPLSVPQNLDLVSVGQVLASPPVDSPIVS